MLPGVLLGALLTGCGSAAPTTLASPGSTTSTPTPAPTPTVTPAGLRGTVRVVGLGDSVTAGAHCDCDDYVTGFGHLLARRKDVRVRVRNHGEDGSTSADLADDLQRDRGLRDDVADADLVVVTTGANDLGPALGAWRSGSCPPDCYTPDVDAVRASLGQVLDRVRTLDGGRARVLVTTYWNVFTDGDVARRAERTGYLGWSDAVTRRADAAIAQVATTHGATTVDLFTPFKGDGTQDPTRLLAADGDHPDAAGTALISRAVLGAYEAGG